MFRPMIVAPVRQPEVIPAATSESGPSVPPVPPCALAQAAVVNIHSCSLRPPSPIGFSRLWLGPAVKPSSDIDWSQMILLIAGNDEPSLEKSSLAASAGARVK